MSRVGDKIKQARTSANMTQKALAKKLGVAEKYINEVEVGRRIINEDFIQRIEKVLNVKLNDVNMLVTDEELSKEEKEVNVLQSHDSKKKKPEVNEMWNQAFAQVLKNVPIYDGRLQKVLGSKPLAVHDNKIEGYSQDKVFYMQAESDDMIGFRIQKGDHVLCSSVKEFSTNGIYVLKVNDKIEIRQVKRLDSVKVLLLSNKGSVMTETFNVKEVQFLARAVKVEFNL